MKDHFCRFWSPLTALTGTLPFRVLVMPGASHWRAGYAIGAREEAVVSLVMV
jgi:hypothetical protein